MLLRGKGSPSHDFSLLGMAQPFSIVLALLFFYIVLSLLFPKKSLDNISLTSEEQKAYIMYFSIYSIGSVIIVILFAELMRH